MSLHNLSIEELESLLMEETKKLTLAFRDGMIEEKENQRNIIEGIQKLLAAKRSLPQYMPVPGNTEKAVQSD